MKKRQSGASSPCKNGACQLSPFPNQPPPQILWALLTPCPPVENLTSPVALHGLCERLKRRDRNSNSDSKTLVNRRRLIANYCQFIVVQGWHTPRAHLQRSTRICFQAKPISLQNHTSPPKTPLHLTAHCQTLTNPATQLRINLPPPSKHRPLHTGKCLP